ncbi:hypothetical protein AgCh_018697 [Apium graveolens]
MIRFFRRAMPIVYVLSLSSGFTISLSPPPTSSACSWRRFSGSVRVRATVIAATELVPMTAIVALSRISSCGEMGETGLSGRVGDSGDWVGLLKWSGVWENRVEEWYFY